MPEPQCLRHQARAVAFDHAGLLERDAAARALRGRKSYFFCQLLVGQPSVVLQAGQQAQIEIVEVDHITRDSAILCALHAYFCPLPG